MRKIFKYLGYVLLGGLIIIQFFRPTKNLGSDQEDQDISTIYKVPDSVHQLLKSTCYDCHSNTTQYPWYAEIQPVAWWLDDHIQEGKKELNFNLFASYSPRRQYRKLEEIVEEVKEGEMPLDSYTWVHRDAKLTIEQRASITSWAEGVRETMRSMYPADSLQRKK